MPPASGPIFMAWKPSSASAFSSPAGNTPVLSRSAAPGARTRAAASRAASAIIASSSVRSNPKCCIPPLCPRGGHEGRAGGATLTGSLSRSNVGHEAKAAAARPRAHGEVQTVADETIALYRWLAWIAEELYGSDARGAARRWTLRRLHRDGPKTVTALARIRAVRRQTLQPII